jgi:spore maturation protein CgeB
MRVLMFYHSLLSDWNHGNAHFLRGVVTELLARGHQVKVYEPEDSWSLNNLISEYGQKPIRKFYTAYPGLDSTRYSLATLDLEKILERTDLVIVHEWNSADLVSKLGEMRARTNHFRLLFHDTHHRMATAPETMSALDLSGYDGVLAYGKVLQELYQQSGRVKNVWTWHEAADTRVFFPHGMRKSERDVVWIGNWGDDERTEEIHEFLIEPVKALGLKCRVYGVRYPGHAQTALTRADIEYGGWLPNFEVPRVFARSRLTLHIPRRPYVKALPGIPTIRVFEALACGIPLICSPWDDAEKLFRPGVDYLVARSGHEMTKLQKAVLHERGLAAQLAQHGLETIRSRHTCAHRVDELLNIHRSLLRQEKTTALCQAA